MVGEAAQFNMIVSGVSRSETPDTIFNVRPFSHNYFKSKEEAMTNDKHQTSQEVSDPNRLPWGEETFTSHLLRVFLAIAFILFAISTGLRIVKLHSFPLRRLHHKNLHLN